MTLIQIAEAMDAQLARLYKVRAIVATLLPAESTVHTPTDPVAGVQRDPEPPQTEAHEPSVPALQPRKARTGRLGSARLPHVAVRVRNVPATALNGVIPQGPVAISAADAVRSRPVEVAPNTPVPSDHTPGHSLDDLVRQLTGRSVPGPAARVNTN